MPDESPQLDELQELLTAWLGGDLREERRTALLARLRDDAAFRKLYDARSVLTMTAQGVTEFATANVKDFEGLGFRKVWNPIAS